MQAAGYEVSMVVTDYFRLDGGAMFGSVPKTLWSKRIEPDDANRIPLACRVLVLKGHGKIILVDVGCGTKWKEKERGIYAIEHLLSGAAGAGAVGAGLASVFAGATDIILTHLHFDHAGGISTQNADGSAGLTFPQARVYLQQDNWSHANHPGVRERASYLEENIRPLESADLRLVDDGQEIIEDIRVFRINGHTRGMQWILIGQGSDAIAYAADLIPTSHHLPVPYVMGYDICAETSMREKEAFLEQAVTDGWRVMFEHDRLCPMARVARDARGAFCVGESLQVPLYVPPAG